MKKSKSNKKATTIDDAMRFLTGHASATWMASKYAPRKNHLRKGLVPIFQGFQMAHDRLVHQEANRLLIQLVKGVRAKLITRDQVRKLFQMDVDALKTIGTLIEDEMRAKPNNEKAGASSCQFIKRRLRSKSPFVVHPTPGEIPR
jgi:hypothetical protein